MLYRISFYQINKRKEMFRNASQIDAMIQKSKNKYFYFLKQHVILGYPEQINRYRSTPDFIISIEEIIYIIIIKDFFK